MIKCPALGHVPGVVSDDLKIKVSQSGVIFLPQTRYRKRYTGSKFCEVAINGKLYLDRKKLEMEIKADGNKDKKKSGRLKAKPENISSGHKDTNTLPTSESDLSTQNDVLSTTIPQRYYSVNKTQVRQRLLGFINTQKGAKELYFWTITFPKNTPDQLCYQLFNIWLTSLRKYRMLREYLWIVERQPQTNTLHFHIGIPHRMCVHRANRMMAGTLKTFAKRGDLPNYSVQQCARYNGVDIAKDRRSRRVINFANKKGSRALASYLTKYLTKAEGQPDNKFVHLAWHNSRGYSAIFTGVTFTIPEFQKHGFNWYLDRTNIKRMEFAVFIPWNSNGPPVLVMDHLYQLNTYVQETLNLTHESKNRN